ncbi:MAG TPA: hypothetical protein VF796_12875 [Humisphaera sp.]
MRDHFVHTAAPADDDGPRRPRRENARGFSRRRPIPLLILVYLWALPTTFVGLLFVPAALVGGRMQVVDGVLELYGGVVATFLARGTLLPGGASAMTLGHVVLGRDRAALDRTRSHERVHVRQVERWGPLFLPAYVIASLVAAVRGKDASRDNPFERDAFEDDARRARGQ